MKHSKLLHQSFGRPGNYPGEHTPAIWLTEALLSVFNRMFEKVMDKRLKSLINKTDMFFISQYGFRENCSTQHAILDILNKIQNNTDKRLHVHSCGIFIDLKKGL